MRRRDQFGSVVVAMNLLSQLGLIPLLATAQFYDSAPYPAPHHSDRFFS